MTAASQSEMRDSVRVALKDGRLDEAKTMLAVALGRWPDAYWILMLQAEVLKACGDIDAAFDVFRTIHERFPDRHWAALGAIRLLFEQDRQAEARAFFENTVWTSAVPDDTKSEMITALSPRRGKLEETVAFLGRLLGARPGNPAVLTRLAMIRARQGLWDEAVSLLDEIAARGPVPEHARAIHADLLSGYGRFPEMLAIARELAAGNPQRVDYAHRVILALSGSGAHQEAAQVLKDAAVKWPGDWRVLFRLNRIVPVQPLWDETFAIIESSFSPEATYARSLYQFAVASLRQGKTEQSLVALDAIARRGLASTHAEPLQYVLGRFSPEEWRARTQLADDQTAQVQIVGVEGADTTIVIFGGIDFGLSSLPFGYVDALLSTYRANVVYLRDFNFRAYFEGISSLASSAEQTLDRLREILERLGTRRTITIGYSVGGFAAIRYGARLGAEAAISFGAPSTLEEEFEANSKPGVGYRPKALKRALSFRLSDEIKDLIQDLAETASIRVFFHYAAQYPAEVAHANRLRDLDNVELRPLNISDHSVAMRAIADGILDRILVEEIGVPRN